VDHHKFEGHVTLNKDECQKSVRFKISILSWLAYVHTGREDIVWNRPFSQLSDLLDRDLDLGSGLTVYRRVSLIDLFYTPNFLWNDGRTDGRTDVETGLIRSTWRSWRKNPAAIITTKVVIKPPLHLTHSVKGSLSDVDVSPSVRLSFASGAVASAIATSTLNLHSAEGAAVSHDSTIFCWARRFIVSTNGVMLVLLAFRTLWSRRTCHLSLLM